MKKIKVLIADDSIVYRSQIKAALSGIDWIEFSLPASNGRIAFERMCIEPIDLLILDIEMPEMDGLETLKAMKEKNINCKVLVFSSISEKSAQMTMEALRLGASDLIIKPGNVDVLIAGQSPSEKIRSILEPKILALFPREKTKNATVDAEKKQTQYPQVLWNIFSPQVVVIGSSTGGPTVLEYMATQLKSPLHFPIIITQHMPPIFTKTLAERVQKISGIPTYEATHGMQVNNGCIYIAPGDYHMRLSGDRKKTFITLDQEPLINSVRPAVDPMFSTAADIFKERCLAIVLTGMGADGQRGAIDIKKNNGAVLIQSEKSCIVFGMPGAVKQAGAFDAELSPDEIIKLINSNEFDSLVKSA